MSSNILASSARSIFDAGPLDEVEHLIAVLLANRIPENRAEQPDVLAHRLGGLTAYPRALYRADRFECHIADHPPSIGAR
jgi:hypothetical protein